MAKKIATPADVRLFAVQNGITVGKRGRFSADLIARFNKESGSKYAGPVAPTRTVKAIRVSESGRKTPVQKNLTVAAVRAAAAENGVTLKGRGRLPLAAYQATVTGDWTALAATV